MSKAEDQTARIVLITKTRTQNQGNQALSIAWRDFLASQYEGSSVHLVERAPGFLKRYTLSGLDRGNDLLPAFDRLAQTLLERRSPAISEDPGRWDVLHDPDQQQVVRFLALRKALRIRSRLAALNIGSSRYFERLAYICGAQLVVVNPAGEFQRNATDTALHYLLETRCAQLAGCRTAFVNLSFEIEDESLVRIARHVFKNCDVLEFRDRESADYFARCGGETIPIVLPDAALLSRIDRTSETKTEGLALAINALQVRSRGLSDSWDEIVGHLCERGPVVLTSNEWTTDFPFWRKYLHKDGVNAAGRLLDFSDYARFLGGLDRKSVV